VAAREKYGTELEELLADGIETGSERARKRALGKRLGALPAGLPLAPVPGYWYATANVWYVNVSGQYERFAVRTNRGDGTAATTYLRDGAPSNSSIRVTRVDSGVPVGFPSRRGRSSWSSCHRDLATSGRPTARWTSAPRDGRRDDGVTAKSASEKRSRQIDQANSLMLSMTASVYSLVASFSASSICRAMS
jgi:hypothetical protein